MRVAALYDIHGNYPALKAVLLEIESSSPDLILVGGDLVLGPMPPESLERRDRRETMRRSSPAPHRPLASGQC